MKHISFAMGIAAVLAACGGVSAPSTDGDGGDGGGYDSGGLDAGRDALDITTLESCEGPGTCVLGAPGCCGAGCGTPPLATFVPIHWDKQQALRDGTCDPAQAGMCPGCASMPEPNYQAFCRSTKCEGVDVRTDAISSCTADTDCTLRYASCCEPCGAPEFGLVALRPDARADFRAQVCLPNAGACSKCLVGYPATKKATCNTTTGHCVVTTN